MCWACEEEQMLAAYREYVAQRKAERRRAAEGAGAGADAVMADPGPPDWAKGTWFAAATKSEE